MSKDKSFTSVMPYNETKENLTKSRDTARILTHSATISHSKKKKPMKKGWGKIQAKTEDLMKEKHDQKPDKRKSFAERQKSRGSDRRLRITAQIDEIRAEQADKLYKKEMERKKSERVLANPREILQFIIHPKSTWKQVWDIMILGLVVFSACYIPMTLAFPDMQVRDSNSSLSFLYLFVFFF
jgi:hypothetical protein